MDWHCRPASLSSTEEWDFLFALESGVLSAPTVFSELPEGLVRGRDKKVHLSTRFPRAAKFLCDKLLSLTRKAESERLAFTFVHGSLSNYWREGTVSVSPGALSELR